MIQKLINILFIFVVLSALAFGLVRTFVFPKEMNYYENRYAYKAQPFSVDAMLTNEFQDSVEKALSDQIPKASSMKKKYNENKAAYIRHTMLPIFATHPDRYFKLLNNLVFGGDQLVYPTRDLTAMKEPLAEKAQNYNRVIRAHPDVSFYSFFIEKDTDIQFETGEKVGAGEYFFDLLELPPAHKAIFAVDSYEMFRKYFYRTDHHWNNKGSYEGYRQVLKLLGCNDPPLVPVEEVRVCDSLRGSKNISVGAPIFNEPLYAYRFDMPRLDITIHGDRVEDYGTQAACFAAPPDETKYSDFYGADIGEVVFRTGRTDRENILVIGESYDNAILKLLASHFNTTYSVDLRYYSHYMNQPLHFSDYIKRNDIQKVLWIGNVDFYLMNEFALEN